MPLPDCSTPKVSVCIPVLNGEGRLENCLSSLRGMDWPEDRLEIIIADGGSTDASRQIAEAANWVFRVAIRGGYSVQADILGEGDVEDLPGCKVIYRAEAVRDIGTFNEGLVTAEDVDFHQRMISTGWRLRVAPGLKVLHHKRPTAKGLFRQLRRYAEGRVQLGRQWPGALRPGHAALAWSGPVAALVFAFLICIAPQVSLAAGAVAWALLAFFAHTDGMSPRAAVLAPLAAAVVATGWSVGYLRERFAPMPEAYVR